MLCKICNNISLNGSCCNSNIEFSKLDLNIELDLNKINVTTESANTSEIVCSKCKSNQIKIKTFQNRSADESTTVRMHCLNCGHKESGDSVSANL